MTTKTKMFYSLGALFAACAVGCLLLLFVGPSQANRWLIGATTLSSGWLFAGFGFGPASWARTAVPSAIAGAFELFYVVDDSVDSRALILISDTHLRDARVVSASALARVDAC